VQKPYFDPKVLPFPPVPLRFALVCSQMLIYHERFPPTSAQLLLYRAAVDAQQGVLEAGYKAKVQAEFLAAVKGGAELRGGEASASTGNRVATQGVKRQRPGPAEVAGGDVESGTRLTRRSGGGDLARRREELGTGDVDTSEDDDILDVVGCSPCLSGQT
jgi:hypothetical protein